MKDTATLIHVRREITKLLREHKQETNTTLYDALLMYRTKLKFDINSQYGICRESKLTTHSYTVMTGVR